MLQYSSPKLTHHLQSGCSSAREVPLWSSHSELQKDTTSQCQSALGHLPHQTLLTFLHINESWKVIWVDFLLAQKLISCLLCKKISPARKYYLICTTYPPIRKWFWKWTHLFSSFSAMTFDNVRRTKHLNMRKTSTEETRLFFPTVCFVLIFQKGSHFSSICYQPTKLTEEFKVSNWEYYTVSHPIALFYKSLY